MPAVKDVGEPCAGEPHARFDGGWEETRPVGLTQPHSPGASRLPDQPLGREGSTDKCVVRCRVSMLDVALEVRNR